MTDHASENARVTDPYCPLHGSRPTTYDLCSCKNKVVIDSDLVERACEVMHDAYETAALAEGWTTQERSRVPWDEVPAANQATMRIAVLALLEWQHFRNEQDGDPSG